MSEEVNRFEQALAQMGLWEDYKYIRLFFSKRNPNNRVYHPVGFIENHLVVKRWDKYRRRYNYECLDKYYIGTNSEYLEWKKK